MSHRRRDRRPARLRWPRRRVALLGAVLTAALLLSGCVSLPTSGPIVASSNTGTDEQTTAVDIDPLGPQRDAQPDAIVSGFLDAMLETPIRTNVAREFLTAKASADWQPARTITYESHTVPQGTSSVSVSLTGADLLDAHGAWKGRIGGSRGAYDLSFDVVRQDGQWRIVNPPDALVVPESWFQERFRQVSLYFFDPTSTVLVPEPVFVPTGRQLASSLISGLLAGPPGELSGFSRDLIPTDLHVALSVPVSAGTGIADVQLTGDGAAGAMPPPHEAALMIAQLTWTLHQDPQIQGVRVSIGGQPVEVSGKTEFSIKAGDSYAPYVDDASTLLYGLRDGRLVGGSAQNLDPVSGPFGAGEYALRSAVPDLRADRAAVVGATGTSLLVGPIRSDGGVVTEPLSGAENLLTPAWDFAGRVWEVDRRATGSVVYHVDPDGTVSTLQVPQVTGADVKAFLVSRDGSRLVAVVHRGAGDDVLVVSRILSSPQGQVLRAVAARSVSEEDAGSARSIRDIAWRSSTSIVVLHPVGPSLYQVRTATVDGAPTGLETLTLTLTGNFSGLAGTPSPGESIYAVGRGRLVDLSGPRAGGVDIDPDVEGLTYPG